MKIIFFTNKIPSYRSALQIIQLQYLKVAACYISRTYVGTFLRIEILNNYIVITCTLYNNDNKLEPKQAKIIFAWYEYWSQQHFQS